MNNLGKVWENELEHSFDALIRSEGLSSLVKMPEPTAPKVMYGKFVRVLCGKAPYDFTGMMKGGKHIAMEAKHNDKRKTSLPIIAEDKDGSGLQQHQLEALAKVAVDGGIARIVWNNGGLPMAIGNEQIIEVCDNYLGGGRKSIPRDLFTICEQRISQGVPYFSWLDLEDEL